MSVFLVFPNDYLLRAARTSAGCTMLSWALLPQLLRVKVITAAMSVSDNCFHGGMADGNLPLCLPFSSTSIWPAFGPSTTGEPTSEANAPGTPWPLAWWQATQLVENTCCPLLFSS